MKKLKLKIKKLCKNKDGFVNVVTLPICIVVAFSFLACFIALLSFQHKNVKLDRFAYEIAVAASQQGKCTGKAINERYKELEETLGISPTVSFDADYFDYTKKTVQYGDTITVTLTLDVEYEGWGSFDKKRTFTSVASRNSMEYWK